MLQEAAQEFVGRKCDGFALMITAVPVAKGHCAVVEADDGLVGDCRLVHVATEAGQDAPREVKETALQRTRAHMPRSRTPVGRCIRPSGVPCLMQRCCLPR